MERRGIAFLLFGKQSAAGFLDIVLADRCRVHAERGLDVVTLYWGDSRRTWWIDPKRDWACVRVQVAAPELWRESRTQYRRTSDGNWFPERVEMYHSDFKSGSVPVEIATIENPEFNRPEHPLELTPTELGIEPGVSIRRSDGPGAYFWDGTSLISPDEYYARVDAGLLEPGPMVRSVWEARSARKLADSPAALRSRVRSWAVDRKLGLSRWEAYVKVFCDKYSLDHEQREAAYRILRDCQSRAEQFISRNADKIREIEDELATLQKLDLPPPEAIDAFQAGLIRLFEPINTIFERQLKPRLEKLPTRAQREAATSQPASAPSGK